MASGSHGRGSCSCDGTCDASRRCCCSVGLVLTRDWPQQCQWSRCCGDASRTAPPSLPLLVHHRPEHSLERRLPATAQQSERLPWLWRVMESAVGVGSGRKLRRGSHVAAHGGRYQLDHLQSYDSRISTNSTHPVAPHARQAASSAVVPSHPPPTGHQCVSAHTASCPPPRPDDICLIALHHLALWMLRRAGSCHRHAPNVAMGAMNTGLAATNLAHGRCASTGAHTAVTVWQVSHRWLARHALLCTVWPPLLAVWRMTLFSVLLASGRAPQVASHK